MFRIECYCDDKRVGDVLQALKGLIHPNPNVVPVANVQLQNGQVKALVKGDAFDMFIAHLKKNKVQSFRAREVQAFLVSIGRSKDSASYFTKGLRDRGLVRKTGSGFSSKYHVKV